MDQVNKLLDNRGVKTFLILITGIFSGYILQPVPKWFNELITKSHLFKFIILFIIGLLILHPIDKEKLIIVIVASIIILTLLQKMRDFDK